MCVAINNIIYAAGLDPENMDSIKETKTNEEKLKKAFRQKWEDKLITDKVILDDLIDFSNAPGWIKKAIEQERDNIVHEIRIKKK